MSTIHVFRLPSSRAWLIGREDADGRIVRLNIEGDATFTKKADAIATARAVAAKTGEKVEVSS